MCCIAQGEAVESEGSIVFVAANDTLTAFVDIDIAVAAVAVAALLDVAAKQVPAAHVRAVAAFLSEVVAVERRTTKDVHLPSCLKQQRGVSSY